MFVNMVGNLKASSSSSSKTTQSSTASSEFKEKKHQKIKKNLSLPGKLTESCKFTNQAPKFLHTENARQEDIENVRKMIKRSHYILDDKRRNFFKKDFERLLVDDWIISRFLFKAYKEAKKRPKNGNALEQAFKRLTASADLCYEYKLNSLVTDEEFPLEWRMLGGLVVGEPDLNGNPTVYFRLCFHRPKLLEDEEQKFLFRRLLLYAINKAELGLINKPGKALAFIFDFNNVSYENHDLDTMAWLIKLQKNTGPKIQAYTMIYNMPWVFNVSFKLMASTLITGSNR